MKFSRPANRLWSRQSDNGWLTVRRPKIKELFIHEAGWMSLPKCRLPYLFTSAANTGSFQLNSPRETVTH